VGEVMSKFDVNYSQLENKIYKKAYKLSEVKDKIEKVAFDIVKFKDGDNAANLWQVQSSDDGDYIIALYDSDDVKTANSWEVDIVKNANAIQISYKGDPLLKISAQKLGIPSNEIHLVSKYLPKKLANNKKLVASLLSELGNSVKEAVLRKYPELI